MVVVMKLIAERTDARQKKVMLASHRSVPRPCPGPAEAMALNQRYLNPQLGRVLRTLGFDREWTEGCGSHLIDRQGREYLDLKRLTLR